MAFARPILERSDRDRRRLLKRQRRGIDAFVQDTLQHRAFANKRLCVGIWDVRTEGRAGALDAPTTAWMVRDKSETSPIPPWY